MSVPLLDLKAQYRTLESDLVPALLHAFEEQAFVLGQVVEDFERAIAGICQVEHAIGVSSASDALLVSLMAEGIGPGDEVITSPFCFVATAEAIQRTGAKVVFADIQPKTFNIATAAIAESVTERTRAMIPVHLFGQLADMDGIRSLANDARCVLIEDAAQAIAARRGRRAAGSWGDYACLSFFPSKNLGGAGDGGMVLCRDAERAAKVRRLRAHGASTPHHHEETGGNFRLDALQATVLLTKLPHLASWTDQRRVNAATYRELLSQACLVGRSTDEGDIVLPVEEEGARHVYNQFTLRARQRDEHARHLRGRNIGCGVYYPTPLHLQPCFAHLELKRGAFPEAERAAKEVLSLPIYPELTTSQLEEVVGAIADFYRKTAPRT